MYSRWAGNHGLFVKFIKIEKHSFEIVSISYDKYANDFDMVKFCMTKPFRKGNMHVYRQMRIVLFETVVQGDNVIFFVSI